MRSDQEGCGGESLRFVDTETFRAAMAMLGLDIDEVYGVEIGNWRDRDDTDWPFAAVARESGVYWRVRALMHPSSSGVHITYVGIRKRAR